MSLSHDEIVVLITFATKVKSSLPEEDGSKIQVENATRQCEAFLSVMSEVQSLSHVTGSFQNTIDKISTSVRAFVKEFVGNIARYEKLDGNSKKLVEAAEDLAILRQSLAAQLGLVKVIIQANIL